ncbi:hypothetical protein NMY22_g15678 [Coprinellus aureogranulatus]|nr:hypothetical protein NMY22_g15678 [Coprinellus aureogranulatus]
MTRCCLHREVCDWIRRLSLRIHEKKGIRYGGGGFIPDDDDDEDAYQGEDAGDDSEEEKGSDEDFLPGPRTRRTRTPRDRSPESAATTPSKPRRKPVAKDVDPTKLSAKQKQAAFDTFALFFPDVKEEQLKTKRLMIKDVQRVAGLLKEKIKAEEMIDMLEMFSTSPDKSMSYDDFVRMLVAAGLV